MFFDKIYGSWKAVQFSKYEKIMGILPDLRGKKILDIGIGSGYFEEFLKNKGIDADIIGVDVGRLEGKLVVMADGNDLPFADDSFDIIICLDTLQFIKNNDFSRVLKSNGHALFSIFFNKQNFEERETELKDRLADFSLIEELVIEGKENEYVILARKR